MLNSQQQNIYGKVDDIILAIYCFKHFCMDRERVLSVKMCVQFSLEISVMGFPEQNIWLHELYVDVVACGGCWKCYLIDFVEIVTNTYF